MLSFKYSQFCVKRKVCVPKKKHFLRFFLGKSCRLLFKRRFRIWLLWHIYSKAKRRKREVNLKKSNIFLIFLYFFRFSRLLCCLLFRLNDDVYILKSVPETMDKKFKFDEFVMIVDVGSMNQHIGTMLSGFSLSIVCTRRTTTTTTQR